MINKLFMDRKKRDEEFKRLKAEGHNVCRRSTRNQLLHPMYVEDYPQKISEADKGFGNNLFRTHFSVLYTIDSIY